MSEKPPAWFPGAHLDGGSDRAALVMASTGHTRTYGELDSIANRVAGWCRAYGLQPGDHVALWFDNELDYPSLWWGAHYAGLYYTLISTRLTAHEAAHIIADSGSRVVFVSNRLHSTKGSDLRELVHPSVRFIVDDDTAEGLTTLLRRQDPIPAGGRLEGSAMLYSSGTTGQPSAISQPLSGLPLGSTSDVGILAKRIFNATRESVYLSPAPLYHSAPHLFVSGFTALGAQVVLMEHFDAEQFLEAVQAYRVTHTQLVPTMFVRLLALPDHVKERYDLSSLVCAIHSAAPCPIPVKQAMLDWWGPIIHEYYSATERIGFVHCSPQDWLSHPGSVGRPLSGAVHILDDSGNEVPPGIDGDIYFSGGPKTGDPPAEKRLTTVGDIGRLDADGFLYLTDRRDNMIIVGGVNVYPQEAENVLAVHPKVYDVAVLGVPHMDLGEEVVAVITPTPGTEPTKALEEELLAFCRGQLASIKCPRTIQFSPELPREPNGKLRKRLLRVQLRDTLTQPTDPALRP